MPSDPMIFQTSAIVASPATTAEIVIASVGGIVVRYSGQTIKLRGNVNITPGADTTECRLRIRRSTLTGTLVGVPCGVPCPTGFATLGMDAETPEFQDSPGEVASMVYVLTAVMTAASAAATVNAVSLVARVD